MQPTTLHEGITADVTDLPQIGVPQIEDAQDQGFFRLSHSVFTHPALIPLPGDAFRVYLWMASQAWRYPDSDGTMRAAVTYVVNGTGVSKATVSRCFAILKKASLIKPIEINYAIGNVWKVSDIALAKPTKSKKKLPHFEHPQIEVPQNEDGAASKRGSSRLNLRQQLPQNEVEVRSTIKQENNNSLSANIESSIDAYFRNLNPAKKRESERSFYKSLQRDYSDAEIAKALALIQEKGLPSSGEPCHSPMAFLAKAISSVLKEATQRTEGKATREKREHQQGEIQAAQEAEAREEEDEIELRNSYFHKVFPEEVAQIQVIRQYASKFPMFNPTGPAVRSLAIGAWWNEYSTRLKGTERNSK